MSTPLQAADAKPSSGAQAVEIGKAARAVEGGNSATDGGKKSEK